MTQVTEKASIWALADDPDYPGHDEQPDQNPKSNRAMRALTDEQLHRWRNDLAHIISGMSRDERNERKKRPYVRTLAKVDDEIGKRNHYVKHVHADFIECNCGHLAVTESDFEQHVQQIETQCLHLQPQRSTGDVGRRGARTAANG